MGAPCVPLHSFSSTEGVSGARTMLPNLQRDLEAPCATRQSLVPATLCQAVCARGGQADRSKQTGAIPRTRPADLSEDAHCSRVLTRARPWANFDPSLCHLDRSTQT